MNRKITKRLLMERAGLLNENEEASNLVAEVNTYLDTIVKEYKEENGPNAEVHSMEKLNDSYKGEDVNIFAEADRGGISTFMRYLSDYDDREEFNEDCESEACVGYIRDGKFTKTEIFESTSMNENDDLAFATEQNDIINTICADATSLVDEQPGTDAITALEQVIQVHKEKGGIDENVHTEEVEEGEMVSDEGTTSNEIKNFMEAHCTVDELDQMYEYLQEMMKRVAETAKEDGKRYAKLAKKMARK